jgi:RsbT co-antagonist protein rsbRD N-terminal domain
MQTRSAQPTITAKANSLRGQPVANSTKTKKRNHETNTKINTPHTCFRISSGFRHSGASGGLEPRPDRKTMDQKILSELGDYLLAHREQIIDEWLRAVGQNPEISSFDHLEDKEELLDHLPELCQNLAEFLKSPQSDQNRAEVFRAARVHGRYRWRQGYRLEEVIREASIVRRILSHNWLDAYAREVPKLDGGTRRAAENIIHQAVDDVISDSAEQFVEEQLKSTSHLNSQLADALAEVRQQKAATDAAKTTPRKDS